MPRQRIFLLLIILICPLATRAQDAKQALNDQLWEAARKGDAAAVKALLDKGADVNAKFRYGATALSYAADKGHVEVVNVLLERGADVNVKDTFYQSTPIQWAIEKGHVQIIKALLDKGAEGVEDVLLAGAREGNAELVRIALAKGGLRPETLTQALVAAQGDEKKTEITALLKKAGAVPPPEIPVEVLQSYAGKYKSEQGLEITVAVKDGKFYATAANQQPLVLSAVDKVTFKPVDFDGLTIIFNVESGKATGMSLKQGANTTVLKRVE